MSKRKLAAVMWSLLMIAGCANQSYQAMPSGSTEPSALVSDTLNRVSGSRAQVFIVQSVDGHRIANSMDASQAASRNQGAKLTGQNIERQLPLRAMQLTLEGRDISAMPIAAILGSISGHYHSVEGVVTFTPSAGHRYLVTGTLTKESSSIWIEDADSHEPATEKIMSK